MQQIILTRNVFTRKQKSQKEILLKFFRLQAIVGHTQTIYYYNSLNAKMTLQIVDVAPYSGVVDAREQVLSYLRDTYIPNYETIDTDLWAFFTHQNHDTSDFIGLACIGTLCAPDQYKGYRSGITEYFKDDMSTAEVLKNLSEFFKHNFCFALKHQTLIKRVVKVIFRMGQFLIVH